MHSRHIHLRMFTFTRCTFAHSMCTHSIHIYLIHIHLRHIHSILIDLRHIHSLDSLAVHSLDTHSLETHSLNTPESQCSTSPIKNSLSCTSPLTPSCIEKYFPQHVVLNYRRVHVLAYLREDTRTHTPRTPPYKAYFRRRGHVLDSRHNKSLVYICK